jgi:hypothetical protein
MPAAVQTYNRARGGVAPVNRVAAGARRRRAGASSRSRSIVACDTASSSRVSAGGARLRVGRCQRRRRPGGAGHTVGHNGADFGVGACCGVSGLVAHRSRRISCTHAVWSGLLRLVALCHARAEMVRAQYGPFRPAWLTGFVSTTRAICVERPGALVWCSPRCSLDGHLS